MDIKTTDVGVIIGRFQTPNLHTEHIKLIEFVMSKHDKVIIFLGVSPTLGNKKHPMDFLTRKLMLEEEFKLDQRIAAILPLKDQTIKSLRSSSLVNLSRSISNHSISFSI